jgi:hypothetical protein
VETASDSPSSFNKHGSAFLNAHGNGWSPTGKPVWSDTPSVLWLSLFRNNIGGIPILSMVDHFGHRYRFISKYIDSMPEAVVQDAISHELAHGHQSARGIRCLSDDSHGEALFVLPDGREFGGRIEIAYDADSQMLAWGFDPESVQRWMTSARVVRVTKVAEPCRPLASAMRRMKENRSQNPRCHRTLSDGMSDSERGNVSTLVRACLSLSDLSGIVGSARPTE